MQLSISLCCGACWLYSDLHSAGTDLDTHTIHTTLTIHTHTHTPYTLTHTHTIHTHTKTCKNGCTIFILTVAVCPDQFPQRPGTIAGGGEEEVGGVGEGEVCDCEGVMTERLQLFP